MSRRKKIRLLCSVGISLLIFYVTFGGCPLKNSPETTVLTAPLAADGSVDYFAYFESLYPPNIATDDNGARIVVRALGPGQEYFKSGENDKSYADMRRMLSEKLGLDPNAAPEIALPFETAIDAFRVKMEAEMPGELYDPFGHMTPEERYKAVVTNDTRIQKSDDELTEEQLRAKQREEIIERFARTETQEKIEEYGEFIGAYLDTQGAALDVISQAAQKELFIYPMVHSGEAPPQLFALLWPDIQNHRELIRSLALRAEWRIHQGKIAGAIADRIAVRRLGTLMQTNRGAAVVEILLGISGEGSAARIPVGGNFQAPLTADDWRLLRDELDANRPTVDLDQVRQIERFILLDLFQRFARGKDPLSKSHAFDFCARLVTNANIVFKEFNRLFDQMQIDEEAGAKAKKKYSGGLGTISALTVWGRSKMIGVMAANLLCPTFVPFCEATRRTECLRNLQKINFAMQLYRLDHDGRFPPAFTVGADGKPLHSWRVLILPYLGDKEKALYEKIKIDESWESEANRAFHGSVPTVYRCPSAEFDGVLAANATSYSVVVGPETLFDANGDNGKTIATADGATSFLNAYGEPEKYRHTATGEKSTDH